jgi:hypothetical protein
MADPRSLFGERRLPEFLGGKRVDYYIPPEVRQGVGGLLAGLQAINPLTGLREYERAMRGGDYPAAAAEALMLAAPGAGALLARGIGRAVPSAVRAVDDAADAGSEALQETLLPLGAMGAADDLVDITPEIAGVDPDFIPVLAPPPATIQVDPGVGNPYVAGLEFLDERSSAVDELRRLEQQTADYELGLTAQDPFGPDAFERLMALRDRRELGEFDDFLSEEELAQNYARLSRLDRDGMLTERALVADGFTPDAALQVIDRFSNLNRRFAPPSTGESLMYSRAANAAQKLKQPVYTDPQQVRRELEARGAPGRELDFLMGGLESAFKRSNSGRLDAQTIQEILDASPRLEFNRSKDYEQFSPPGGRSYEATYVTHPKAPSGPEEAFSHFGGRGLPPLFHTRAAEYDITREGRPVRTHHVIEIQSDWAQHRQSLPDKLEPLSDAENLQFRRLGEEYERLVNALRDMQQEAASTGRTSDPGYQRVSNAMMERVHNLGSTLADYEQRVYGIDRPTFDKKYPAPFVRDENDWVDAGVRQTLLDAVSRDTDYITFGNGRQASQHVGMPLEAAQRFYDRQVPRSVERVLKRFAREAGIDVPSVERVPFVDGDEVLGVRLTPELRETIRRVGLPSFRDGGLVSLLPM